MQAKPHQAADEATPPPRLLRLPTVIRLTGLGRSTLYRMIANHQFPSPVRIGCRAVAWRQADIAIWIDERVETH